MTEQDLTALAKERLAGLWGDPVGAVGQLAAGYLALVAERDALRDALKAQEEARGEDEPDITIGTKSWTDEQVAEMMAIAKRADLRHARELLESSGFVVSEALPKPVEAQD